VDNSKPWVLIPTALRAHVRVQLNKWSTSGYNLGLLIDIPDEADEGDGDIDRDGTDMALRYAELVIACKYPGVWKAWNILAKAAVGLGAQVCVLVGDDMDPDPSKTGAAILDEYVKHFPILDGVMQPCGDLQGADANGVPAAARICGSPWVGADWIRNAYLGCGPVNDNYNAFYADEELLHYATRRGKLWMRPDLTQYHAHWSWGHLPLQDYHQRNQLKWQQDKDLFEKRKAGGFL